MPQFPRNEPDIIALAQKLVGGLIKDAKSPNLPVGKDSLQMLIGTYTLHEGEINQLKSQLNQKIKEKNDVLEQITKAVKADLRYLEIITDGDNARLNKYGWAARRRRKLLKLPEQPRLLEVVKTDSGNVFLDWKAPIGGGRVVSYKIQRHVAGESDYHDIDTTTKTEIELKGQPRKAELQYRVVASNRAGESQPSNTVTAVL